VFSKVDLVPEGERAKRVRRLATEIGLPKDEIPVVISAATGLGLRELLERAYALVKGSEVPTEWRR
jgi:50S ribosomal subunit-associated GTPase HflX